MGLSRTLAAALFLVCALALTLPSVSADNAASAPVAGAHPTAAMLEYDPDEMTGLPEDENAREVTLDDDAAAAADAAASKPFDIWADPEAATKAAVVPPTATDPERVALRLDFVQVQWELRRAPSGEATDNAPSRLIDSSKKLGRDLWIIELGSGTAISALNDALLGSRIGEKRTVPLTWSADLAAHEPHLNSQVLSSLRNGDAVVFTLEIVRFDRELAPPSVEDRFWNALPMLSIVALFGFRIWRAGVGAEATEANKKKRGGRALDVSTEGAAANAPAAGKPANASKRR